MADRPQMPPPPDGCAYGPWWDDTSKVWLCIDSDEFAPCHHSSDGWDYETMTECQVSRELLRLAKELTQKEKELEQRDARIKELEAENLALEERIQRLERSLRISKSEMQSCNEAFSSLLQIPVFSWQRNWQAVARIVLELPPDADVETINLAMMLRREPEGGQDV